MFSTVAYIICAYYTDDLLYWVSSDDPRHKWITSVKENQSVYIKIVSVWLECRREGESVDDLWRIPLVECKNPSHRVPCKWRFVLLLYVVYTTRYLGSVFLLSRVVCRHTSNAFDYPSLNRKWIIYSSQHMNCGILFLNNNYKWNTIISAHFLKWSWTYIFKYYVKYICWLNHYLLFTIISNDTKTKVMFPSSQASTSVAFLDTHMKLNTRHKLLQIR